MIAKKTFIIVLILFLIGNVLCPYGRYLVSQPDLSKTSQKFEGFTIDFRGIDTPTYTYWCLLQWYMDISKFKESHPDATGGLAYGGLQTRQENPNSIISFWEIQYKENGVSKSQRATRVYPPGQEGTFTGEGEGNNYISAYNWSANVWYRYTIYSWEDRSTGNTFVGQWIQNLSTKEWTLYAYFDTKLKDSYITGPLFQFQENYSTSTYGQERSAQFKNMYVFDNTSVKWISLDKTRLYVNFGAANGNTAGTSELGFTSNYFFMSSGLPVDDQKTYDANHPTSITATITQPSKPDFTDPSFKSVTVTLTTNKFTIYWSIDSKASPCYQYHVHVYQSNPSNSSSYNLIKYEKITRPEIRTYSYSSVFKGDYKIQLYCNAISRTSIVKTIFKTV